MTTKEMEAAIYFARMWGVMETLEPVPQLDQKQVQEMVLGWAKEFTAGQMTDEVDFFVKKTAEWKNE